MSRTWFLSVRTWFLSVFYRTGKSYKYWFWLSKVEIESVWRDEKRFFYSLKMLKNFIFVCMIFSIFHQSRIAWDWDLIRELVYPYVSRLFQQGFHINKYRHHILCKLEINFSQLPLTFSKKVFRYFGIENFLYCFIVAINLIFHIFLRHKNYFFNQTNSFSSTILSETFNFFFYYFGQDLV